MPQSLARVRVHLVFSTKYREPLLKTLELREHLYAYMAAVLRDKVDSPAIIVGGVEDHVHALVSLSRNVAISQVVKDAKTETTKWLKKQSDSLANMQWQAGYAAFSVSESRVATVERYISNQVDHHRNMTFQDEFRVICSQQGVEWDERYVWD